MLLTKLKVCMLFGNEDVDKVMEGLSYTLEWWNRECMMAKYMYQCLPNVVLKKLKTLGMCQSNLVVSSGSLFETMVGEIIWSSVVDKYHSCLFCSGQVEGRKCGKCGPIVKSDHCPLEICAKIHVVKADLERPFVM